MRRTAKLAGVISIGGVSTLVACTGGGGSLPSFGDGWDTDHGARSASETPTGAQDVPTNGEMPGDTPLGSSEPPPGGSGGGGGALVCSGIYECVVTGTSQSCTTINGERQCTPGQTVTVRVKIALEEKNGACYIGEAVLEPNGTLRGEDGEVGTWSKQGQNLVLTSEGKTLGTCTPSSGTPGIVGGSSGSTDPGTGSTSGSGSGSGGTSSTSSSSSSGDISIDPGPQGDAG